MHICSLRGFFTNKSFFVGWAPSQFRKVLFTKLIPKIADGLYSLRNIWLLIIYDWMCCEDSSIKMYFNENLSLEQTPKKFILIVVEGSNFEQVFILIITQELLSWSICYLKIWLSSLNKLVLIHLFLILVIQLIFCWPILWVNEYMLTGKEIANLLHSL